MICTSEERDALMAMVGKYGYAFAEWSAYEGDPDGTEMWRLVDIRDGYLDEIRAMLAPPDDAVVRDAIAKVIDGVLWPRFDEPKPNSRMYDIADQIIALLRGEATRDE